jgi:hypothetical protein
MDLVDMAEKLLESSMLLERWETWANQYGSLINEETFYTLKADTAAFFKIDNDMYLKGY